MQCFASLACVCIDDVNKSFLPVDFGGGGDGVNRIGLGDNSTEWNIIGILFTNEKADCVDTENNELNRVLSSNKKSFECIRKHTNKRKWYGKVFSTIRTIWNKLDFLGVKFNRNTCSIGVNCVSTVKSLMCATTYSHVDFSIHPMHFILSFCMDARKMVVVQRELCNVHVKVFVLQFLNSNFVKSKPLESFQSITAITLKL